MSESQGAAPAATAALAASPQPYRCSALYRRHLALGATMVEYHGWRAAERFTSAAQEARWVREGVGLADVSWLGKLDVRGAVAERLSTAPADAPATVHPEGAPPEPSVPHRTWRLAHEHALVTCLPEVRERVTQQIRVIATTSSDPGAATGELADPARKAPSVRSVHVTDVTSAYAALLLAGPQSQEVLNQLTDLDVSPVAMPSPSAAQAGLAHVHAIFLRSDLGDAADARALPAIPAYWLLLAREYGEYVWEAIVHAGREFGIMPVGVAALDTLTIGR